MKTDQLCDENRVTLRGHEDLQASHDKCEENAQLPSLANLQMIQTRQRENKDGDVGENMRQADIAIAGHDVGTVTNNGLVPLVLERLAYGEGRNDIGDGVGYAHPNNNPCADAHTAFRKDPEVQDQDGEFWEEACCHVHELGCCL